MNWESERDMARDVEENPELYAALADDSDVSDRWNQLVATIIEEDDEFLRRLADEHSL